MAIVTNFSVYKYEDGILNVSMTPPTAIGGWSIRFAATKRFGGVSGLIEKFCASGYVNVSGINILDSGQGKFTVAMNSVDTSGLDFMNYAFDCSRIDSGSRIPIAEGYLSVLPVGVF